MPLIWGDAAGQPFTPVPLGTISYWPYSNAGIVDSTTTDCP